jgi:diguanylate cyclase (GGDEF)-like protein/PAS domain S-box-containing protein
MAQRLRVLHVEDNVLDAELVGRAFAQAGIDVDLTRVDTEQAYLAALEAQPQAVISDYSLPQFSGVRALEILRQRFRDVPFILVSGTLGEEKAVEIMRLGADDYLLKDRLVRLPAAVEKAIAGAQGRAAQNAAKARWEQALRESEALKSAIMQASLDALVTIDARGNIIEFNPAAERTFGFSRAQALGQPMADLIIPPSLRAAHRRGFAHYLATGAAPIIGKRLELTALRADGSDFPIEITVVSIGGQSAPVFTGFIRDITDRKLAEERIKRLNRVHTVLSGINAAIVRTRDRQQLFMEACRIAVEAGGFVMAWIGMVDRDAGLVRPVASAGDVRDFFERAPLAVLDRSGGHGLAGRAVRSKAAVISNDVKKDPQRLMRRELEERGINSLALLPLLVGDEVVGTLALYAADAGSFDDEEMRLLTELAGDVSFALDHIEKAQRLDYISYYDPLTGLPNRTLFHERLKLQLEDAARGAQRVALQILDIQRFKTINDTLGRQAGDALLAELAKRMQAGVHASTWLARIGADHFAIVTPGVRSAEEVARRTDARAREAFDEPFMTAGTELRVSARIGTALSPDDGADADTLLRNAEAAVKKAKSTGERHVFYTQELSVRIAHRLSLENQLRDAVRKDELVLHYQPRVDLVARRIVGVEALMRWQSPQRGLVPPAEFIPLLEETGLIIEAGAWALRRAALDHRAWAEAGLEPVRVAVNVSGMQLRQGDFLSSVQQAIEAGVKPPGIDLELTESLIMDDVQANIRKLGAVRDLGVALAIDDFGTGYSSLAYLARLPVQTLKIDRSFVITMVTDPAAMALVQTIISLAHALRLKVVAEGVETEEQANILRLLRCEEMQGYLFSRPLPNDALVSMLQAKLPGSVSLEGPT